MVVVLSQSLLYLHAYYPLMGIPRFFVFFKSAVRTLQGLRNQIPGLPTFGLNPMLMVTSVRLSVS